MAQACDVQQGGRVREAGGQKGGFEDLRGKGIEDIEAPGEGEEGDGEMHEGGVDWFAGGECQ